MLGRGSGRSGLALAAQPQNQTPCFAHLIHLIVEIRHVEINTRQNSQPNVLEQTVATNTEQRNRAIVLHQPHRNFPACERKNYDSEITRPADLKGKSPFSGTSSIALVVGAWRKSNPGTRRLGAFTRSDSIAEKLGK